MNIQRKLIALSLPAIYTLLFALAGLGQAVAANSTPTNNGTASPWQQFKQQTSQAACANWRWVAKKKYSKLSCQRVPNWRTRPLFEIPEQFKGYRGPLGDYCVYEAENNEASVGELKKYLSRTFTLEQDCFVALNMATSLGEDERPYLQKFMDQQVDFPGLPHPLKPAQSPVRLAVLDTSPDFDGRQDHFWDLPPHQRPSVSDHGYTLANIMHRLTCPDEGRCAIGLVSSLALPIYRYNSEDPDRTESYPQWGGYFGSIANVGEAVMRAVSDWKNQSGGSARLVINLSVGWDPDRFGGIEPLKKPMPLAVESTFKAIRFASCLGALTVAANGNDMGGQRIAEGALAPAMWEQVPAPDRKECAELFAEYDHEYDEPAASTEYNPMIYGISGLKHGTRSLDNARANSLSRIAAFGDHATVVNPKGLFGWSAGTLTGSSVSAAVVSATAAKVWSYQPKLSARQVMDIIYGTGYNLGRLAETCLGGDSALACPSTVKARRLSYCRAVKKVCSTCASMTCNSKFGIPIDLGGLPLSDFIDPRIPVVDAEDIDQLIRPGTQCRNQKVYYDPSAPLPAMLCPQWQMTGISDDGWSLPQPMKDQCPNCTIIISEIPSDEDEGGGIEYFSKQLAYSQDSGSANKGVEKSTSTQGLAFAQSQSLASTQTLPAGFELNRKAIRLKKVTASEKETLNFLVEIPNLVAYETITNVTLNVNGVIYHLNALNTLTRGQSAVVKGIPESKIESASVTFVVNYRYAITIPILVAGTDSELE